MAVTKTKPLPPWQDHWLPEPWISRIIARIDIAHNCQLSSAIRTSEQAELQRRMWAERLSGFEVDQIQQALAAAESADRPPKPNEFRRLCLRYVRRRNYRALAKPRADRDKARAELAAARKAIKQRMRPQAYRPGDADLYTEELQCCREYQLPLYLADMRSRARAGWHEADEQRYREMWLAIPGNRLSLIELLPGEALTGFVLYPDGHEPPHWLRDQSLGPLRADIDHWIATAELPFWVQ